MPDKQDMTFFKRIENFFYHYKNHTIIMLIFLALIAFFTYSQIQKLIQESKEPDYDINIIMVGNFHPDDDAKDALQEKALTYFKDIGTVKIQIEYFPEETEFPNDIYAQQKSFAVLSTRKPDIYIFDQHLFNTYKVNQDFLAMDDYFDDSYSKNKESAVRSNEDDSHVYGINITNTSFFADTDFNYKRKIAMVRKESDHIDKAIQVIKKLTQD